MQANVVHKKSGPAKCPQFPYHQTQNKISYNWEIAPSRIKNTSIRTVYVFWWFYCDSYVICVVFFRNKCVCGVIKINKCIICTVFADQCARDSFQSIWNRIYCMCFFVYCFFLFFSSSTGYRGVAWWQPDFSLTS